MVGVYRLPGVYPIYGLVGLCKGKQVNTVDGFLQLFIRALRGVLYEGTKVVLTYSTSLVTVYRLLIRVLPGETQVNMGRRLEGLNVFTRSKSKVGAFTHVICLVWVAAKSMRLTKVPRGAQKPLLPIATRGGPYTHRQSCARRTRPWGYTSFMARNPFTYDRDAGGRGRDESSEFGFGPGHFPDPNIDYSLGGVKSGIPIADPDPATQLMDLMAARRTDVSDPDDVASPYVCGNTDRFGAQPPLVRERRAPMPPPRQRYTRPKMRREY